jgi:TolB protein
MMASPNAIAQTSETPRPITTEPQGKIVFACQISREPARNQLCLINADGSDWKRLSTDDTADYTYPTFTPDGQAVIFSLKKFGSNQIYEIDLSGNFHQLSDLTFDAYAPSVSADNRNIVFTVNDGSRQTIWTMNRDGTNPHQISDSSRAEDWDPTWSPDRTQILFASNRDGAIQLFVMDADGSNAHRLTSVNDLRGRSDWSPDGKTLSTYKGSAWHREIVLLSLDGKELTQLTDGGNNLAPNFSPNGQWIAFTSYRDHFGDENGCEIYIIRIDGSQVMRLTNNDYCDWQPNWGP